MNNLWIEFHKQLNPMLEALKKLEEQNKTWSHSSISEISAIADNPKEVLSKVILGKPFENLASNMSIFQDRILSIPLPDYSSLARSLKSNQKFFDDWMTKFPFKEILAELGRETPYNFADLLLQEQLELISLAAKHSFGIVECIPTETLREILTVKENESSISNVLVEHEANILDSCFEIASNIISEGSGKEVYASLLIQGIDCMKSGIYAPAQAILTILWDSYLVEESRSRKPITQIIETRIAKGDLLAVNSLSDIYTHAAYAPAVSAFQKNPFRSGYSRNGTIHYATQDQFNEGNAICALTVATGLLGRNWRIE